VAAGPVRKAPSEPPAKRDADPAAPSQYTPFSASKVPPWRLQSQSSAGDRADRGSLWLRSTWKLPATVEATTSLPALIAVPAEAETSVRDQTAKVESVTVSGVPSTDSSLVGDFYFSPPPVVADVPSSKLANAPQVALPPAPRLFPRPVSSADRDEITGIIERARGLVAVGDIPTARVVLRRAYERGDERAALELGGTYDPLVLRRLNTVIKKFFRRRNSGT